MAYISQKFLFEVAPTLEEFSITWATDNGHWAHVSHASMTSFHSSGDTMNIRDKETGNIFTVCIDSIKEFANKEVTL